MACVTERETEIKLPKRGKAKVMGITGLNQPHSMWMNSMENKSLIHPLTPHQHTTNASKHPRHRSKEPLSPSPVLTADPLYSCKVHIGITCSKRCPCLQTASLLLAPCYLLFRGLLSPSPSPTWISVSIVTVLHHLLCQKWAWSTGTFHFSATALCRHHGWLTLSNPSAPS